MTPLIAAGLELMLVGMGTVFFFLTLLVLATTVMSRLASRIVPTLDSDANIDLPTDEEVAAISIAVTKYRQSRGDT